jgi:hypothetical protein
MMARNTRYFSGIGKGKPSSSFIVFDSSGKIAVEFDKTPDIASRTLMDGEILFVPPNGQTLELDGDGPVRVETAQEKRDYLEKTGTRPAPETRFSKPKNNRGTNKLKKTFAQHFYEERGVSLKEYLRTKYGEGADLVAEL